MFRVSVSKLEDQIKLFELEKHCDVIEETYATEVVFSNLLLRNRTMFEVVLLHLKLVEI